MHNVFIIPDVSRNNRLPLWTAIALVGAVFFFVVHDFRITQYDEFVPWADAASRESGGNALKGLAMGLLGLFGAYLACRDDGRTIRAVGWLQAFMVFYVGWSALSVLWSIDPAMSCRRLLVLVFCILAAFGFTRQFRPRDIVVLAMAVAGAYLIVGIGTELCLGKLRPWTSGYRFAGTVHPNSQGSNLAILCMSSLCLALSATRGRRWFWAIFSIGLLFLLLTRSRTACAAMLAAVSALWFISVSIRTRILAAIFAGLLVCTAALAAEMFNVAASEQIADAAMLGRREESEALTGRVPIWNAVMPYVKARPLQGYGFESFWTLKHIDAISGELFWPVRETHNSFLETVLSVGLIGAAAYFAAAVTAFGLAIKACRNAADPGFPFTVCLLTFGLVSACLESGMAGSSFTTLLAGTLALQLMATPCKSK